MRKELFYLIVLLGLGMMLAGCGSDSTAPDDQLPAPTAEDVATQSGAMASTMMRALPRIWDPTTTKDNGEYTYTFTSGPVLGTIMSEFRDAEGGSLVDYDVAAWCRIFTGDPLAVTLVDGGVAWQLGFNLTADINQGADTATAAGGGSLVVGDYTATFTLAAVVVHQGDDYPASGTITFVNEGITATVTFDGDAMVTVTVGDDSWTIDLDDGSIS
ncbi:MAG: hypothetical protein R3D98_16460 [Candidatus Krumholzibacteriia bacterium]